MRIRTRVSLCVLTSLLLACSSISFLVFFTQLQLDKAHFTTLAKQHMEYVESRIHDFMEPPILMVDFLSRMDIVRNSDGRLGSYLRSKSVTTPTIASFGEYEKLVYDRLLLAANVSDKIDVIFIANKDGQYLQAPVGSPFSAGYDPRKTTWYAELFSSSKDIVLSKPYSNVHGDTVCSVMKRIIDYRGRVTGMVGIDFRLDSLAAYLNKMSVMQTGRVVLMDSTGIILADGFNGSTVGKAYYDVSPVWRHEKAKDAEAVFEANANDGRPMFVVTKTIPWSDWRLGIIFEKSELTDQSWQMLILIASITTIIILVFGYVAYSVSNGIVEPLSNLVEALRLVSRGSYVSSSTLQARLSKLLNNTDSSLESRRLTKAIRRTMLWMQNRLSDAQAASKAKTDFLANVNHELRTPMNGILGQLLLLSRTDLGKVQREYCDRMAASANSLLSVINNILDFSQIDSRETIVEKVQFEPVNILNDIENTFSLKSRETGVDLVVERSPIAGRGVIGDPSLIRQVLHNLVDNAFKFTNKGSVHVGLDNWSVASDEQTVLCFYVRDTGVGMDKEQIEKNFQPFVQAESGATRSYGGIGLGLAVCQKFVAMMGGSIEVESEVGKGTKVSFCLSLEPVATLPESSESVNGNVEPEAPNLVGMRILMAEDNEINAMIVEGLLEDTGAELTTVENGKLAVDLLEAKRGEDTPFDLVLMDLQMPVMGGHEATRLIRAMPEYAGLPIVALTAHAFAEEIANSFEAGMNKHLTKPIDLNAFYSTLLQYKPHQATVTETVS